ncbi:protein of unknown function [Cupriavidus taiwanensis]|uniref:Uncharacterized protein n=1 Tax=Cupriavidus taiwanensis TaxID=164546 RepID=A0A7Z7J9A1_9BURK|nr:protein of unknown function [Cupriavidus taiwanensis]SOZ02133.1 hypothetical protein CBM2595_A30940 [Cupriavidus taiwanensis]SOZ05122.1 hypothetical protein CBM2597_A51074 [Cupriavidus taiwanensis]SPC09605.1 hypothetical protein CBM2594_A40928 [Cupriavidus taiwanensis]SPD39392.1 protein of unknown function [Cupriavidus taiwanensis]
MGRRHAGAGRRAGHASPLARRPAGAAVARGVASAGAGRGDAAAMIVSAGGHSGRHGVPPAAGITSGLPCLTLVRLA